MSTPLTSSVLMSVYHRVTDLALSASLGSLLAQTRPPNDIVIVMDGPLPDSLQSMLELFRTKSTVPVKLLPLSENQGLVAALNYGLQHCEGDWIIRMDADDISLPHRFERQLGYLDAHSQLDVLGTSMLEFDIDPTQPDREKTCRTGHANILGSFAFRNPLNHPTVCVRRQKLEEVGGYPQLTLLEDYYLWAKLALSGANFENLLEPLYLFRFDDATLERRAGFENFKNEIWLRHWMFQKKLISPIQLVIATLLQIGLRLTPLPIRRFTWHRSRRTFTETVVVPNRFEE